MLALERKGVRLKLLIGSRHCEAADQSAAMATVSYATKEQPQSDPQPSPAIMDHCI